MTIGQHINLARNKKDMSLRELAEKADVNYNTLVGWIYQNHHPDIVILISIADVLEISLDELVGRKVNK